MNFWIIVKKKLMKRGKKRLNTKLKRHITEPRSLPYEVSVYISLKFFILVIVKQCVSFNNL